MHHDNFALWDSAVTPWNSAKMGPRRDIVGQLAKAYRARGLKFLPTFHHGFAWRYFEPAFQFDAADGENPLLYTEPHGPNDPPSPRFLDQWLAMVMEVVQKYEPDMIWFGFELTRVIPPEYQRRMFADYYNWAAGHGRESAVAHKFREIHQYTGVLDFERGREDKLVPYPWLTDTALGPWFNQKSHPYRSTDNLVHVLADIVSKNGCMLLNVGPRADGSIPPEAEKILSELGDWLRVNGEAIYATRPWEVFGEGPTRDAKGGGFSERIDKAFTPRDIRFTKSKDGATLHAIVLGVPDAPVRIRSLAAAAGKVTGVTLLGSDAKLAWSQDGEALAVELPAEKPCGHAIALRIAGKGLVPVPIEHDESIPPSVDGAVRLRAGDAALHGQRIRVEARDEQEYVAAWDDPQEYVSWKVSLPKAGAFRIRVEYSSAIREVGLQAELGGRKAAGRTAKTTGWYDYRTLDLGTLEAPAAGKQTFTLRPQDPAAWKAVNIRSVSLTPLAASGALTNVSSTVPAADNGETSWEHAPTTYKVPEGMVRGGGVHRPHSADAGFQWPSNRRLGGATTSSRAMPTMG